MHPARSPIARARPRGAFGRFKVVTLAAALTLLWAAPAWAASPHPLRHLAVELERIFHAEITPCTSLAPNLLGCFSARPANVAQLAETLEAWLQAHGGSMERSAWSSSNGTHRVQIALRDRTWGSITLYLTETRDPRTPSAHVVHGVIEHTRVGR